jgi:hypothetical protein
MTHDLLATVLLAFGAKVDRVIINEVHGSVFHARMILSAENELHSRKLIELDTRPSDSIAMAVQQGAPLFVAQHVWDSVDDMTDTLAEIEKRGQEDKDAAAAASIEDDDADVDEIDPDELDLDLDALAGINLDLDEDKDEEDEEGYNDGYQGSDDDDEGEEWKKK